MKNIFKLALKSYLKIMAKLALAIHRPRIIVVAGSINKTFVKEQIARELNDSGKKAMAATKSFNTEIGLPVAILSLPSGYGSYHAWLPIIFKAPLAVFDRGFPEIMVLEFGVSNPGDMKFLLSVVRPEIAVITDITQRYAENFPSMEKLVGEYRQLLKNIKKGGVAVLNSDNEKVKSLSRGLSLNCVFFGFGEDAEWRIVDYQCRLTRQTAKIKFADKEMDYEIDRPGRHQLYALLSGKIIKNIIIGRKS